MWAAAFYLVEHYYETSPEGAVTSSWCQSTVQMALLFAGECGAHGHGLYLALMSGLERLVLKEGQLLSEKSLYHGVVKLCTDLLTETNAAVVLPAVQLFLATMYVNSNSGDGSPVVYDSSSSDETVLQSPTSETDSADRYSR